MRDFPQKLDTNQGYMMFDQYMERFEGEEIFESHVESIELVKQFSESKLTFTVPAYDRIVRIKYVDFFSNNFQVILESSLDDGEYLEFMRVTLDDSYDSKILSNALYRANQANLKKENNMEMQNQLNQETMNSVIEALEEIREENQETELDDSLPIDIEKQPETKEPEMSQSQIAQSIFQGSSKLSDHDLTKSGKKAVKAKLSKLRETVKETKAEVNQSVITGTNTFNNVQKQVQRLLATKNEDSIKIAKALSRKLQRVIVSTAEATLKAVRDNRGTIELVKQDLTKNVVEYVHGDKVKNVTEYIKGTKRNSEFFTQIDSLTPLQLAYVSKGEKPKRVDDNKFNLVASFDSKALQELGIEI